MPPRFSYWTIIAGGLPTAFRAAEREELLPTFTRLKEKQPDAEMKWFARGKLWESPEAASDDNRQRARGIDDRRPPRAGERRETRDGERERPRGKDWRPGGEHRDPRQKFKDAKKARNLEQRQRKFERKHGARDDRDTRPRPDATSHPKERFSDGDRPKPPRYDRDQRERPAGGGAARAWADTPRNREREGGDWRKNPRRPSDPDQRPFSDKPARRESDRRPEHRARESNPTWRDRPKSKPFSKGGDWQPTRGWTAKPSARPPRGDTRQTGGSHGPRERDRDRRDGWRPKEGERERSDRQDRPRAWDGDRESRDTRPPKTDVKRSGGDRPRSWERDRDVRNTRSPKTGERPWSRDRDSRDTRSPKPPDRQQTRDRDSRDTRAPKTADRRPGGDRPWSGKPRGDRAPFSDTRARVEGRGHGDNAWKPKPPRERSEAGPPASERRRQDDARPARPFQSRGFDRTRNSGTREPEAPPRPPGPNREPRPSEEPRPTPPPRPSEPRVEPPGPPERGRLVKRKPR